MMMDTKVLPTRECRFRTFLLHIAENDLDWIGYLQRFFGSYLLGNQPKHKIHVFLGAGSNGKTVLIEAVRNVLNEEYIGIYLCDRFNRWILGRLEKIKYLQEPAREGLIKRDALKYFMRKYKVLIPLVHANTLGSTKGDERAAVIVPFLYRVPDKQMDTSLLEKLKHEKDTIREWLEIGSEYYKQIGLDIKQSRKVEVATVGYWYNYRIKRIVKYYIDNYGNDYEGCEKFVAEFGICYLSPEMFRKYSSSSSCQ
jgi:hypothetical protein